jgi:hypothetical protein
LANDFPRELSLTQSEPGRRLRLFLATTFVITWGSWWALAVLTGNGMTAFGQPLFMTLYLLGGFGPTLAAYLVVLATRRDAPIREFHSRLFRWRVGVVWYLLAFGLPLAIGLGSVAIAGLSLRSRSVRRPPPGGFAAWFQAVGPLGCRAQISSGWARHY